MSTESFGMYIIVVEMISTSQIITNYIPQQENAIRQQIISVVILQYKINWLSLQFETKVYASQSRNDKLSGAPGVI